VAAKAARSWSTLGRWDSLVVAFGSDAEADADANAGAGHSPFHSQLREIIAPATHATRRIAGPRNVNSFAILGK
jgi:hypothetical protein